MAASSASGVDVAALVDNVYSACLPYYAENPKFVFHQSDIFDFDIIPKDDPHVLLQVVHNLMDKRLFKVVTDSEGAGWIMRSEADAKKYRSLNAEQEIVYQLIDDSGTDGLWSRTIKMRTALHDAVFRQCIKALEAKSFITQMRNVEHPTRIMYIRAGLQASERSTGGPWFTDNELDEEFISTAQRLVLSEIIKWSFYASKVPAGLRAPKKVVSRMSGEAVRAARLRGMENIKLEDDGFMDAQAAAPPKKQYRTISLDPFPAGFTGYPTLEHLTLFVENSNSFSQTLTGPDIQQLIEVLIFDDKIERVDMTTGETGYRALRKTLGDVQEGMGVLNEVPCGRCPVFDLCEEGGPVAPSTCEYFDEWLKL